MVFQVLLGEVDEEKEANTELKKVNLEEILAAQAEQQTAKREEEALRCKIFKERGLTYQPENALDDVY